MISLDSFYPLCAGVRALHGEYSSGHAPHALLILGIPGVGKRSLARLLACSLLCRRQGVRPCMTCPACLKTMQGTHPNLLMPAGDEQARSIKIDDLRQMIRQLSLRAGGARAVIIENAQRMTPQAQNALLKSLEEPDADTCFILTATAESGLLPTVRSRCRALRLPPWNDAAIARVLTGRGVERMSAMDAARMAGGSLGDAIQMAEDKRFAALLALCRSTFFTVSRDADVPAAAQALRDKKDDADALFTLVSRRARAYLSYALGMADAPGDAASDNPGWLRATPRGIERVLQTTLDMQKYRASNVSFQACAERLLYTISEEMTAWQT